MTHNISEEHALSTLHHALRAARRRIVITIIADSSDYPVSVRKLSQQIAAHEQSVPLEHATGEPYRNAYNALSQTHLPTLAEADIIIYNSDRQVVMPGKQLMIATMMVALGPPMVQTFKSDIPHSSNPLQRQSTIE